MNRLKILSNKQVVNKASIKSWTSLEQIKANQVMKNKWTFDSYEQIVIKVWTTHELEMKNCEQDVNN